MRTTIRLDDALLRRAKAHAAVSGRSLNDFIADAVRAALAQRAGSEMRTELPTFSGQGLQPGVDLDDSAALLDLMEGEDQSAAYRFAAKRRAKVAERAKKPSK